MKLQNAKPLTKDLIVIFAFTLILTLLSIVFSWDQYLAVTLHDASAAWAKNVHHYSPKPAIVASVFAILFLLIWPLRLKYPTLRHIAIVWLITMIVGGGIIIHLILKEGLERPRPRETVLLGGPAAYVQPFVPATTSHGKSFPSGHVVMGAIFAAPFFSLRRKRKKLARSLLAIGLIAAAFIGFIRITLGAHFFTDVIWSGAIMLATAAIAAHFIRPSTDLKTKYLLPFLVVLLIGTAFFNKFSLTTSYQSDTKNLFINLPCEQVHISEGDTLNISVNIKGYGAPLKYLSLHENAGVVSLIRWKGLYRSLSCEAEIILPLERTLIFDPSVNITTSKPMDSQKDAQSGKISIKHRKMVDILMLKRLNAHLAMQTTPLLRAKSKQIA